MAANVLYDEELYKEYVFLQLFNRTLREYTVNEYGSVLSKQVPKDDVRRFNKLQTFVGLNVPENEMGMRLDGMRFDWMDAYCKHAALIRAHPEYPIFVSLTDFETVLKDPARIKEVDDRLGLIRQQYEEQFYQLYFGGHSKLSVDWIQTSLRRAVLITDLLERNRLYLDKFPTPSTVDRSVLVESLELCGENGPKPMNMRSFHLPILSRVQGHVDQLLKVVAETGKDVFQMYPQLERALFVFDRIRNEVDLRECYIDYVYTSAINKEFFYVYYMASGKHVTDATFFDTH